MQLGATETPLLEQNYLAREWKFKRAVSETSSFDVLLTAVERIFIYCVEVFVRSGGG